MILCAIRHTTVYNPEGIIYGQRFEIPLAESFASEVEAIVPKLSRSFDKVFSSPSYRCKVLAERLFGNTFELDERIKEYDFGAWEGLPWSSIPEVELQPWMENYEQVSPPLGENYVQMKDRVLQFLNEKRQNQWSAFCLVTHGGVIHTLRSIIEGITYAEAIQTKIPYGSVIQWEI